MMGRESRGRESLVDTLLNSLEAERYMRGPLLVTLVEELSASSGFGAAHAAAQSMLERLTAGELVESEFTRQVELVRRLVLQAS